MANLNTEVPKLKLNDGTSIPMLGFGTGTAMYKGHGNDKVDHSKVEQIATAIRLGYRHLDCAEMYGTEPELGVAIKESKVARDQLYVTTKVFTNVKDIAGALNASLKKLQLDHVDLFLIHAPFFAESDADLQRAWADMEAVQASGKATTIGVSNYTQAHLEATLKTAKVVPAINQTEFHGYLQRGNQLKWQQEKGIALSAYGPQTPVTKAKPGPLDSLLETLAKKYAVNEGEICLRWCIDQGVIPITTSSKEQRLSDMMRVCAFSLTPKEVDDISKAGLEKHFRGFFTNQYAADDRT